jgi:hypothetical protein
MNWLNFAALLCYGYVPDPHDRQEVERCHSLEDGIAEAYKDGKAALHRLPSAADLDAVEEERLTRELSHPDQLQRELAHNARAERQRSRFASRMAARNKDLTS